MGVAEGPDPPLHVLSEDKYGEVVLERLQEEVELPLFQELEEVKLKPSIFGLMCKELVVAPCIDLFALLLGVCRRQYGIGTECVCLCVGPGGMLVC